MFVQQIIDTYNTNPYPGLTLRYNGSNDEPEKWERASHVRWLGKPCSLVAGHKDGKGAVWFCVHRAIQDSWIKMEAIILNDLRSKGLKAFASQNTAGEMFCVVEVNSNNPADYADMAYIFAEAIEDWVHQLVIDPNYTPNTGINSYKLAREPEVAEAVREAMVAKGIKTWGDPKTARAKMDEIVKNLMSLKLSMADLKPYIDQI